jgi:hypothetical protein
MTKRTLTAGVMSGRAFLGFEATIEPEGEGYRATARGLLLGGPGPSATGPTEVAACVDLVRLVSEGVTDALTSEVRWRASQN